MCVQISIVSSKDLKYKAVLMQVVNSNMTHSTAMWHGFNRHVTNWIVVALLTDVFHSLVFAVLHFGSFHIIIAPITFPLYIL